MRRAVSSALVLGLLVVSAPRAAEKPRLDLTIETPQEQSVIGDPGGMAFVSGHAMALFGEFQPFDIVFVIDVSDSTRYPSGADIDGDGKVGHRRGSSLGLLGIFGALFPSTDPQDSILAAEILAVRTMLDQLDPRTTRVGVVAFGGDSDALTPDAATWVPLTTEYAQVRKGLKMIARHGSSGKTNMLAGVQLAAIELMGRASAFSEPREGARRIMIFLTDGQPTLPLEGMNNQNMRMAIAEAKRAAKEKIRIDTYAIGDTALSNPIVTVEMASVSHGIFTPVRHPRDLRAVFESVNFSEIDALEIHNKTTGKPAANVIRNADGSFSALLPMRTGENTVEVYARSTDGTEARRFVRVQFMGDAGIQELTPRLLAQRNRLLENRIQDLRRRNIEIQTDRDEAVRRDLQVEIESERAAAIERSNEARRQLRIEVDDNAQ